jgi:hypothetical protein
LRGVFPLGEDDANSEEEDEEEEDDEEMDDVAPSATVKLEALVPEDYD